MKLFFRRFEKNWSVWVVVTFWVFVLLVNDMSLMPNLPLQSLNFRDGGQDFDALYTGGSAVAYNFWEDLYPVRGDVPVGIFSQSFQKRLSFQGIPSPRTHWFYPPPAAVLWAPLARTSYANARRIWGICNVVAFSVLLGLVFRECQNRCIPTRVSHIIVLLCGLNLYVAVQFYVQNIAFFVAVAILCVQRAIRDKSSFISGVAIVFLGVTKGFSAPWIPLFFLWRKWRLLGVCVMCSIILLLTSAVLGCGTAVYKTFFSVIVPHCSRWAAGDSFPAAIRMVFGGIDGWMWNTLDVALLVFLSIVYYLSFQLHRQMERSSVYEATAQGDADVLALMATFVAFQVFSNLSWSFYRLHLIAFAPMVFHVCHSHRRFAETLVFSLGYSLLWAPGFPLSGSIAYAFLLIGCILSLLNFFPRKENMLKSPPACSLRRNEPFSSEVFVTSCKKGI